jgi:hypothetical protein
MAHQNKFIVIVDTIYYLKNILLKILLKTYTINLFNNGL